MLGAAAFAAYYYFADFASWRRLVVGGLHAAAQIGAVGLVTVGLAFALPGPSGRWLFLACVGVAGGLSAATVMGAYLLLCLNGLGRHWNEAFSSLRIRHFKCFLRLRIDRDGKLVIYPIGLRRVPLDRAEDPKRSPDLNPHLIEPPIQVT
jgi:hypothetical protein